MGRNGHLMCPFFLEQVLEGEIVMQKVMARFGCKAIFHALLLAFICLSLLDVQAREMAADQDASVSAVPLATIATLDISRYMGTWYEIAKYPNRFQKKCTGFTSAQYRLKADGEVQVTNRCQQAEGEISEAIGFARQIGVATSPRLKVSFAPAWLSFIPAVWGNYWVIDLDEDYQLAAVSEPSREYLWVLSRTPQIDQKSYEALLQRLARKGFDLQKLELTRQSH